MFCHLYCFAAATQGKFLLFQYSNIYVIKIGIRDPNPNCKKFALESGIRIRRFFGRIAIPANYSIILPQPADASKNFESKYGRDLNSNSYRRSL